MWQSGYITAGMRSVSVIPVAVAGIALAGPVVKPDLDYGPGHGPEFGHYFNAGTASALARPPGGYEYEQPLSKVPYKVISPRAFAQVVSSGSATPTAPQPRNAASSL